MGKAVNGYTKTERLYGSKWVSECQRHMVTPVKRMLPARLGVFKCATGVGGRLYSVVVVVSTRRQAGVGVGWGGGGGVGGGIDCNATTASVLQCSRTLESGGAQGGCGNTSRKQQGKPADQHGRKCRHNGGHLHKLARIPMHKVVPNRRGERAASFESKMTS